MLRSYRCYCFSKSNSIWFQRILHVCSSINSTRILIWTYSQPIHAHSSFITESLIPVKMKFHPATRRIRIDRFDGLQCLCAFNKSAKLWRAKTRGGEWYLENCGPRKPSRRVSGVLQFVIPYSSIIVFDINKNCITFLIGPLIADCHKESSKDRSWKMLTKVWLLNEEQTMKTITKQ